jgi:hypothetical protein
MTSGIICRVLCTENGQPTRELVGSGRESKSSPRLPKRPAAKKLYTLASLIARRISSLLFPGFFLKATDKLIFATLAINQIIVGKFPVGLFQFAFDNVPVAFDLEFIHTL